MRRPESGWGRVPGVCVCVSVCVCAESPELDLGSLRLPALDPGHPHFLTLPWEGAHPGLHSRGPHTCQRLPWLYVGGSRHPLNAS